MCDIVQYWRQPVNVLDWRGGGSAACQAVEKNLIATIANKESSASTVAVVNIMIISRSGNETPMLQALWPGVVYG